MSSILTDLRVDKKCRETKLQRWQRHVREYARSSHTKHDLAGLAVCAALASRPPGEVSIDDIHRETLAQLNLYKEFIER